MPFTHYPIKEARDPWVKQEWSHLYKNVHSWSFMAPWKLPDTWQESCGGFGVATLSTSSRGREVHRVKDDFDPTLGNPWAVCTICNNKMFGFVNVSRFAHSLFHNFWLKISFKSPWSHKFSITIFTTILRIWGNHVTVCPSSLDSQFKYPAPPVKLHLKFRNWLISYNGQYFYKCLPDATSTAN